MSQRENYPNVTIRKIFIQTLYRVVASIIFTLANQSFHGIGTRNYSSRLRDDLKTV